LIPGNNVEHIMETVATILSVFYPARA